MPPHTRRPVSPVHEKRVYREYLADLEDDEGLGPLQPNAALGDFADEPLMLDSRNSAGRSLKVIGLFLFNMLLLGVLALQYIDSNIEAFVRSPRYAGIMPTVCRVLECPVAQPNVVGNLYSQELLVRSHPRYADALQVSFIFRNDGDTAQPFPAIELGFSDSSNRLIANRLFQPGEYLDPELQRMREMPPQSSLQVMLEMKDPGSEAVNYTLEFREAGI